MKIPEEQFSPKFKLIHHTFEISDQKQSYSLLLRKNFIDKTVENYIKQGIIKEIIGKNDTIELYKKFHITKTTVECPQKIWSNYCAQKHPLKPKNIISITGTNGKTSTCSYITQILTQKKTPNIMISTIGIFENNQLIIKTNNSTPDAEIIHKTLHEFAIKHPDGFAIIETTSIGIEEYRTHNIKPDIAICTNITPDHLDYHETYDRYLQSKLKLGTYASNFFIHNSIQQNQYPKYGEELIKTETYPDHSIVTFKFNEVVYNTKTQLLGDFNAQNILSAIKAISHYFHPNELIPHIGNLTPAVGRLNRYQNIIIDYAHTLDGIQNLFQTVRCFNQGRLIVVIGFGGSTTDNNSNTRLKEISLFLQENADIVILTTDNPRKQNPMEIALKAQKFCPKALIDLDRPTAIAKAYSMAQKEDLVLLIGKGHEDYMEYESKKVFYSDVDEVQKLLGCKI